MKSRLLLVTVLIFTPLLVGAQQEIATLSFVVGPFTSDGTEVTINGDGFRPNKLVELRIINPNTQAVVGLVFASPDSEGSFSVTTTVQGGCQARTVEAWQEQGNTLRFRTLARFVLPCP